MSTSAPSTLEASLPQSKCRVYFEVIDKITIERTTMYGSDAEASVPVSVMISAEIDTALSALVSVTAETEKSGFGRPLLARSRPLDPIVQFTFCADKLAIQSRFHSPNVTTVQFKGLITLRVLNASPAKNGCALLLLIGTAGCDEADGRAW